MNFENIKLDEGDWAIGLRLNIVESDFRQQGFSAPGYLAPFILADLLQTKLEAAGLENSRVVLGGQFHACGGFVRTTDVEAALPILRATLKRYGIVEPFVEFFVYDRNELVWRPLTRHVVGKYELAEVEAEVYRAVAAITSAAHRFPTQAAAALDSQPE